MCLHRENGMEEHCPIWYVVHSYSTIEHFMILCYDYYDFRPLDWNKQLEMELKSVHQLMLRQMRDTRGILHILNNKFIYFFNFIRLSITIIMTMMMMRFPLASSSSTCLISSGCKQKTHSMNSG